MQPWLQTQPPCLAPGRVGAWVFPCLFCFLWSCLFRRLHPAIPGSRLEFKGSASPLALSCAAGSARCWGRCFPLPPDQPGHRGACRAGFSCLKVPLGHCLSSLCGAGSTSSSSSIRFLLPALCRALRAPLTAHHIQTHPIERGWCSSCSLARAEGWLGRQQAGQSSDTLCLGSVGTKMLLLQEPSCSCSSCAAQSRGAAPPPPSSSYQCTGVRWIILWLNDTFCTALLGLEVLPA